MSRPGIAVSVMPLENRREVIAELATMADRAGFDGFYLPETWAYDTTVLLAEAAVKTSRIRLGTGIIGVWNRSAATIAMAAATLASLSSGRFVLGLGASTPQLAEGLHDVPFGAPLGRMRRTIGQVRALLRGDRIPLAVTTAARPLKLNVPLPAAVPIHVAAIGDDSIRLTGELADGWIPFMYPLRHVPEGLARLREGAARGGHPERLPELCPSVPAVVSADAAKAREGAAWFVSYYVVSMGNFYRDSLTRQGFNKEVQAVLAANTPKFAGVVPPDAEALLEQLIVFGTPAEARRRLQRWHAAGAREVGLLLRPQLTPDEIAFTLDAFRPLLESSSAGR
jgi:alkanesulfonate monooxygenase SsuD/methylene tetrahydromethanopterin reductase-like flavin-dependent oxidoreductase (luciferase family)